MDKKIRDTLFFLICVVLIFNNIPKSLEMNFLGGVIGNQLLFYPLFIGFIYTGYWHYKHKNIIVNEYELLKFLAIYLGITLLSLVIGLYNYPYWDLVSSGPIDQIDKLPKVMGVLKKLGIEIDIDIMTGIWLVARTIKGAIFEVFYTFCGSYMIYCWYKNDWNCGFNVLIKAILVSLSLLCIYSTIEVFYLAGDKIAEDILKIINPYIHIIEIRGTWWPPLLWPNQLRSVFAEPSYFGIYFAFALPFIWLMIIKTKLNVKSAYIYIFVACIMSFFLILTKARTGFMLYIGEIVVLFTLLIYTHNKIFLKKGMIILLCCMISFVCGNLFIANYMTVNKNIETKLTTTIGNYIDSNAKSLANPDARTNRARYSVMKADLNIGLDNTFLGVGQGLRNAYVRYYFDEKALANSEIKMWIKFMDKQGVLKSGIPKLSEYTSRYAENGILGLIIFLSPSIVLIFKFLRKIRIDNGNDKLCFITMLVSLIGMMASGIGDSINVTYCYWVLLGLGYAMCLGEQKEKVDNE